MSTTADIWTSLTRNELGLGILLLVAALTVYVLVVTAVRQTRDTFSSKPKVTDELGKHSNVLADLQKSLSGLAPKEKVDELINRLGTFATREEFLAIEIIIQTFITRSEMEDRFTAFQKHIDATLVEWKAELGGVRTAIREIQAGNEARAALLHTLDERSKHGTDRIESLDRKFDRLDTKVDRLIERSAPQQ